MTFTPMRQAYHGRRPETPDNPEDHYGLRRCAEVLKSKVAVVDVADYYCGAGGLRRVGENRWVGRCPLPDHEDRSPSFVVYLADQHFHCFGCGAHGDAIDLERLCGGHDQLWTAVVTLSTRYGVELPRRTRAWHDAQDRKVRIRDEARRVRAGILKRRMFALLVLPTIDVLCEDDQEHAAELERAWMEWSRVPRFWEGLVEHFNDVRAEGE